MKSYRWKEWLCVILLVVFVFAITANRSNSAAEAETVFDAVLQTMEEPELKRQKESAFKKAFGFETGSFEGVCYAASDDVMDVREVLVVQLKSADDADLLMERIEARVQERITLFDGYAPEQAALLQKSAVRRKGNFVLFVVCEKPAYAVRAFLKAL